MRANDLRHAAEGAQARHLAMETRSSAHADNLRLEGNAPDRGSDKAASAVPFAGRPGLVSNTTRRGRGSWGPKKLTQVSMIASCEAQENWENVVGIMR